MARLENFGVGRNVAVPIAAEGAANFALQKGLVRPNRFDNVFVNVPHAIRIAKEYEKAPSFDPKAIPSYKAMADETQEQFDFLTKPKSKGGLGVHVSVTKEDPYSKAADMMKDANEGRFKVFSTASTGGHPFFSDEQNDMFRAVHDFFGHAATGRGFDPHGEEAGPLAGRQRPVGAPRRCDHRDGHDQLLFVTTLKHLFHSFQCPTHFYTLIQVSTLRVLFL